MASSVVRCTRHHRSGQRAARRFGTAVLTLVLLAGALPWPTIAAPAAHMVATTEPSILV